MQFTGVIKQITSYKKEKGILFYIASKDARAARDEYGRVKCVANKRLLHQGLTARFTGDIDQSGVVYVTGVEPIFINDAFTINYLIKRLKGTGIKKSTVEKIVDAYGSKIFTFSREEFLNALNNDFDELGMSIDRIISELYDPKPIDLLSEYLEVFELEESVIRRIFETYGTASVTELKQNPYNVCLTMDIPIVVADMLAAREGFDGLDERRIEGYLRYTLNKYEERYGDTYAFGYEILEDTLNELSSRHIVYGNVQVHTIDIANVLLTSKLFTLTNDGKLSFKKLFRAEETIANRIKALMSTPIDKLTITDDDIREVEDKTGITFGNSQRAAIKLLENDPVAILTGGAGVGKTTVVKAIVDIYRDKCPGNTVTFCAPTGRAAKRLSQSVAPYTASTIHHLLEIYPGIKAEEVTRNQNNPIDADLIIVDETSMVDVVLMSYLLLAVKNGSRVLFVGDENQLPSVSAGNCLYDFIHSNVIPVYRLTDIYRQAENSGIVDNSSRVLKGEALDDKTFKDFAIYEYEDDKQARDALYELLNSVYDVKRPYDVQAIEPMNKDVSETNLYMHHKLVNDMSNTINVGDKIMFKMNAPGLEYVNGEFGVVTSLTKSDVTILNEDGVQKTIASELLYETLTMSYSVTIHKMQGSEADMIIIYLPSNASHMMNKQLLYTAITRACKKCIIISVDGSVDDCINKESRIRRTRLLEMLQN